MGLIKETFSLAASNGDVLAAPSRLTAIPAGGILTIEASAHLSNVTNRAEMTLQLPEGGIPFENLIIPANGLSTSEDIMNTDTELLIVLPVPQGGHVLLVYTEIGSNTVFFIVTLAF